MDIEDWRKKIDELDRKLVALLSERARAAVEIGRLKRDTSLPIYEPDRERIVFAIARAGGHTCESLRRSGLLARIGEDHLFASVGEAVNALHPDKPAGHSNPTGPTRTTL